MSTTEDRVDIFHIALAPPWKTGEPRALRGLSTTGITFFRGDDGNLVMNPDGVTPKAMPDNTAYDLAGLADNPDWKSVVGDVAAAALADAQVQRQRADDAEAKLADLQPKADALPGETARADQAETDFVTARQDATAAQAQIATLTQQLQAANDELARLKAVPMATVAQVDALNARLDAMEKATPAPDPQPATPVAAEPAQVDSPAP